MQDPQPICSDLEEAKKTLQILMLVSHDEDLAGKLLIQWSSLDKLDRVNLLLYMVAQHPSDLLSEQLSKESRGTDFQLRASEPPFNEVFERIAASEGGVKFVLDLRTDLFIHLKTRDQDESEKTMLEQISSTLKTLFSNWFSVSSLQLDRVTLDSPQELLKRVGELEAVHPVRDQAELEARLGKYRRCFVFTHSGMPYEPLVIFHVALTQEINSSLSSLVGKNTDALSQKQEEEEPERINAAMFYSISSTQPGLAGLGLASRLIEGSVARLGAEFPSLKTFATLSPIPGLRFWLLELLTKAIESKDEKVVTVEEAALIEATLGAGEPHLLLLNLLKSISHLPHNEHLAKLRPIVCRLAARYLCLEKKKGSSSALNPVANFHLSNGATIWRLNWMADASLKGMDASFGLMVNYRYFLDRYS